MSEKERAESGASFAAAEQEGGHEEVGKKNTYAEVYGTGRIKSMGRKSVINNDIDAAPDEEGELTVTTASFNLTNNIVGAGMVGLSFVITGAGIIPYVVFILFAGVGMCLTLDMLAAAEDMAGVKDYERTAAVALNQGGKKFSAAMICLHSYGALIAYIVLISTTSPVFKVLLGLEFNVVYLQGIVAAVVILPLCIVKDLSALAWTAMFALAVYGTLSLTVIYSGIFDDWYETVGANVGVEDKDSGEFFTSCPPDESYLWFGTDPVKMVRNFPTIIFAYACHPVAPPIFLELKKSVTGGSAVSEMNKVNRISIAMAGFLYISVGLFGYLAYSNNTFGTVLLNMRHCVCKEWGGERCNSSCKEIICADDSTFNSILIACFLFAVITGYPSVHFSVRKSLISVFVGDGEPFNWSIHSGIAIANVIVTLIVAILAAGNVNIVFNWAGSIASPCVTFILPCTFFLVLLNRNEDKVYETVGTLSARIFQVFGASLILVGVSIQTADLFAAEPAADNTGNSTLIW